MAPKAIPSLLAAGLLLCGSAGATQLELVGTFGGGFPVDIHVQEGFAYCAASGGFLIADVSDPTAPARVSFTPIPYSTHVFVEGARAYTNSGSQLIVLDVSDPASPRQMGYEFMMEEIHDIHAVGDRVYVVCWYGLFDIYDVSDPAHIIRIGGLRYSDELISVFVSGSYAYIAAFGGGLRVVDISDPAAPTEVGRYTGLWVHDVFVAHDLAYVAALDSGVVVLDVADPSAPAFLGGCKGIGRAEYIRVSGTNAYVRPNYGALILDVSDPSNPIPAGTVERVWGGMDASGDFLYTSNFDVGLKVLDASDPYNPVTLGEYISFRDARAVHASPDGLVYLKDGYQGFGVIDASDPSAPVLLGHEKVATYGSDLRVVGTRAYLTGQLDLEAVDVSNPENPRSLGRHRISTSVQCMDVSGQYAYVGSYDGDVRVVDIWDPTAMVSVGSVVTPGTPAAIRITGDYAYMAEGGAGLTVLDISEPTAPTVYSRCDFCEDLCSAQALDVSGHYAYVCDYWGWLVVVDIAHQLHPEEVGRVRVRYHPAAVAVAGCYAYVIDSWHGLKIVDISDPEAPAVVENRSIPGTGSDVSVANGHVFVASRETALHVFRFTPDKFLLSGRVTREEGRPAEKVVLRLSGDAEDTTATDSQGYYEFRGVEPGSYTIRAAREGWSFSPETRDVAVVDEDIPDINFSRKITTYVKISAGAEGYAGEEPAFILFAPESDGEARVTIYTLEGERVNGATCTVRAGVPALATWYCDNYAGQKVASGVYLVRVAAPGLDELKKLVVVW